MTHAWCRDPAEAAAVRAAEDGRDGALPTLTEAIVRAFGFDEASAQRACDEVKSWPEDVQKDCRFVLGDLLEQGVERFQALVEAWRYGKGLMAARYPEMIPKSVSASSPVDHENKGDGMRTERVTLEITHFDDIEADSVRSWNWAEMLSEHGLGINESVRVVEEPVGFVDDRAYADTMACDEERDFANRILAERDAAIRERDSWKILADRANESRDALQARVGELEAHLKILDDGQPTAPSDLGIWGTAKELSARCQELAARLVCVSTRATAAEARVAELEAASGGEQEPVAWAVVVNGRIDEYAGSEATFVEEEMAEEWAGDHRLGGKGTVVPLYRSPPQPRGWLTEEERELIAAIADDDEYTEEGQNIAKRLLARSSPPEVVLPTVFSISLLGDRLLVEAQVKEALAAAGVAVKEVG